MSVANWFETFCTNIRMSEGDVNTVRDRYHRITGIINRSYYGTTSSTEHSLYVGSYGRGTEIHTSDIDMLVELPWSVYSRFNSYTGNGQSALLQNVKNVLQATYSRSELKGDGQIISLPFYDGINFEILPAFRNNDGTYIFANSNNGGGWRITDPKSEIAEITSVNNRCNSNLKRLCRMVRAWRDTNNVPISGILIDILAYNFLSNWRHRNESYFYYDLMSLEFFRFMKDQNKSQVSWKTMGSGRMISRKGQFEDQASISCNMARKAMDAESDANYAKRIWRAIYGSKFPS